MGTKERQFKDLQEATILQPLASKYGAASILLETDSQGFVTGLTLQGLDLASIPEGIWQLSHLKKLDLRCNQITVLSPEIRLLSNLRQLHLNHNQLTQLPAEIGLLTNLQELNLNNNQLTALPPEIGQLTNLQWLVVGNGGISYMPEEIMQGKWQKYAAYKNQLSQLPPEIWKLTRLEFLDLWGNQLTSLSSEIRQLTNLKRLLLGSNQLTSIPCEIGQLINLQWLLLHHSPISYIPKEIGQLVNLQYLAIDLDTDLLSSLPQELWQLPHLQKLHLEQLHELPPAIGQLTNLQELTIGGKHLSSLPQELWQLPNLQQLYLYRTKLSELPSEIGKLTNLRELRLVDHQIRQLPPEIGQLTNLQKLVLQRSRLQQLPPEIGQLTNLQKLDLQHNRLCQLPPEIGQLANLQELSLHNNPTLLTPPPEIVQRGTADILAFLRELHKSGVARYEAKLLLVGEGGTGKTSLLRALRGSTFEAHSSTTHGIEVNQLELYSDDLQHNITLHTWDFGGQHIYHATHQFFLTRRSIYLIVWNARLGVEQGRLHYWLETIKALAPDAPVLLIATHTDEREPDLNYQLLHDTYPQLVGHLSVSNKTGMGLDRLKAALANQAAQLPLTGQPWPQKWLQVEQMLAACPEHHIDADKYTHYCRANNIEEYIAKGTLGDYLHDLGKILYFRDDYILCNLVVLKPNWITKAISLVLTDESVKRANGILQHADLARIWAVDEDGQAYPAHLYPIFLRLMERFDLSYQIEAAMPGEYSTRSLVPQLLPYQPPLDLPPWPKVPPQGQTQVEMVYRFDFVPAGIMSWFIVRTHRYTTNLHWREGVLLTYQNHQARVELNPMSRELRLLVWGIQPQNFFTILMNTVDIILDRFQGLTVQRAIPCICHWEHQGAGPCIHFYSYEELVRRMQARRYKVECAQTFEDVSVPTLLYGIHTSTGEQVLSDIQHGQQKIAQRLDDLQKLDIIIEKLHQQSEWLVRNFTRQWNFEMQKIEAECPNTFFLAHGKRSRFNPKNWISQEYVLHLVCQHPSGPHNVGKGYKLREAEEWWIKVSPWLNHVVRFLKFGVPLGKMMGALYDEIDINNMQTSIDLMEQIIQSIPEAPSLDTLNSAVTQPHLDHEQKVIGPALRTLHSFLNTADPSHDWGGLHKTVTPDGNILWLCEVHRKQYEVKPLTL